MKLSICWQSTQKGVTCVITEMWTRWVSPQENYPTKVSTRGGHTPATEPEPMLQENGLKNLPKHLVVNHIFIPSTLGGLSP